MFKNRSTTDIVVILLTMMVASVLFVLTMGIVIGRLRDPKVDVTPAAELIASATSTALGALVGFIGGRAVGRNEANGENK